MSELYVLKTNEFAEVVLYTIYRAAISEGYTIISEEQVCEAISEFGARPQLRLILNSLLKKELLDDPFESGQPIFEIKNFMINDKGIELIEQRLHEEEDSLVCLFRDGHLSQIDEEWVHVENDIEREPASQEAQASDRIVPFDHNSSEHIDATKCLDSLDEALTKGNDVGDLTSEDIVAARNELSGLQSILAGIGARISVGRDYAKKLLSWITVKASGTVVSELAKKALKSVLSLFGISD